MSPGKCRKDRLLFDKLHKERPEKKGQYVRTRISRYETKKTLRFRRLVQGDRVLGISLLVKQQTRLARGRYLC
jgi:hypothetical protein